MFVLAVCIDCIVCASPIAFDLPHCWLTEALSIERVLVIMAIGPFVRSLCLSARLAELAFEVLPSTSTVTTTTFRYIIGDPQPCPLSSAISPREHRIPSDLRS